MRVNYPVEITALPDCHKLREDLADTLATLGFVVRVNRFGSGVGKYSGVLAGCGVNSITVVRPLERCTTNLLDVWNNLPEGAVSVDGEAHPFPFSINRL